MRYTLILLLILLLSFNLSAQTPTPVIKPANLVKLQYFEDSLKILSDSMVYGNEEIVRTKSCYAFIKKFVWALKTPQSYLYKFDSLNTVSIVQSPDNKFRIITWNLLRHNGTYRYFGTIQMNNAKIQLMPLFDASPLIRNIEDTVCSKDSWYGCMYYNIVPKLVSGKTVYTLFGWKGANTREIKKVMETLYFDKNKNPVFGYSLIYMKQDNQEKLMKRFVLTYNKEAVVSLNYNAELQQVIFDHLITKQALQGKAEMPGKPRGYDMYPDGTYEAFNWMNNRWEYLEALPNITYRTAPTPVPFFDNSKPKEKGYIKTKKVRMIKDVEQK
ncbi:MAG: hypothetical protein RIQ33_1670 [Bacteroidota bacterium]